VSFTFLQGWAAGMLTAVVLFVVVFVLTEKLGE
jgi:tetrahydromethanopterin S-methyltransferase subunit F